MTQRNDDRQGMIWWNRLTHTERQHWLEQAGSARPADAWRAYQRGLPSMNETEKTG